MSAVSLSEVYNHAFAEDSQGEEEIIFKQSNYSIENSKENQQSNLTNITHDDYIEENIEVYEVSDVSIEEDDDDFEDSVDIIYGLENERQEKNYYEESVYDNNKSSDYIAEPTYLPHHAHEKSKQNESKGALISSMSSPIEVYVHDDYDDHETVERKSSYRNRFFKNRPSLRKTTSYQKKIAAVIVLFTVMFIVISIIVGVVIMHKKQPKVYVPPVITDDDDPFMMKIHEELSRQNGKVLVQGMLPLDEVDGEIDIGSVFLGTEKEGCFGVIRNLQTCGDRANAFSVKDPNRNRENVMGIKFLANTFGPQSGVQFFTDVLNNRFADEAVLQYEIRFRKGFDFVKGGVLPGLQGGNMECTTNLNGNTGENCWNVRLSWGEHGELQSNLDLPGSTTTADQGNTVGQYIAESNEWISVYQRVRLNTLGNENGLYELIINGVNVSHINNVVYHSDSHLRINGLIFSAYYGTQGSIEDQKMYLKNLRMYEQTI
eukprot:Awhi_evm2s15828